jgi:hypothetical protein
MLHFLTFTDQNPAPTGQVSKMFGIAHPHNFLILKSTTLGPLAANSRMKHQYQSIVLIMKMLTDQAHQPFQGL